jgi:TonB-linked SusC/RagA family outer membrane protein
MKKSLLTMLIVLFWSAAWAQDKSVSGRVLSSDEQLPLPGVNVIVQGTTKGTTTDVNGDYVIQLGPTENTLVFSFVGFVSKTVPVGNQGTINLSLDPDVTSLNEVVVVGYGTQRKLDITGSVAQVSGSDISKQPSVNPISALQGKVAGVQITNSGAPGSSPQIRIRGVGTVYGNANPLYVVDGVWYDDISWLNPADIENLSVLKDASSTAIFGVRAANGVVMITTKKGGNNQNAVVNYNGFVGNQVVTNNVEMAGGPEYATMINELDAINGATSARYEDPSSYGTTDWYGKILRNALITSHQASVAGGGEKSTYSFSLGYLNQQGIVDNNSFKRYTARLQNDFQAFSFLKIGYSLTGAMNNSTDVPGGIFHQLYSAAPIVPVFYADNTYGDPNDYKVGNSNNFNPQATLDFFDQKSKNYRLTGNLYGEAKFAKVFTFRTSIGGDFGQNEVKNFTPVYVATLAQRNATTVLLQSRDETRNWLLENTLTFDKTFGEDHGLKILVGQAAQEYRNYYFTGTARNVPNTSEGDHYFHLGEPGTRFIDDGGSKDRIASYFTRVNYSFREKYLLNVSFRADGSSKFAKENRWGYFPTVGLGWVITEEAFMQDQDILDNLKVRASWGQNGNRSVPANLSILTVSQYPRFTYIGGNGATFPGASINTITPLTTYWEKGEGTDIGIEATFLDGRLYTEFDFYNRETKNAIFEVPILGHIGVEGSAILGNQATFLNQGFEVLATWKDNLNNSLNYSISGNLSINENKVKSVSTGANPIYQAVGTTGSNNYNTRTVEGQPIGQFYGLKVVGIFQSDQDVQGYTHEGEAIQPTAKPGDFKYADINSDGVIDDKDRIVLGNPNPKYLYGINTNWAYKAFDLTLDLQGVGGVEIYNATLGVRYGTENFTKEFYDNRWHGEGTSNSYPSANIGGGQNYRANSFFVENGSYFRVRNVQLGYTIPSDLSTRWRINRLRLYVNAQNALNFFKYRGFSPEIGGGPTRAGVDINVYPLYATYNFGVNATF